MIVEGSVFPLDRDNVDTDQIIPARYLTGVGRDGLAEHCLEGVPGVAALYQRYGNATVLVARANFGCGSSREHAAWALAARGFHAVVATSFARIFEENAYANGVAPVTVSGDAVEAAIRAGRVHIDLLEQHLTVAHAGVWNFDMDPLRKRFLIDGGFLEFLAARVPAVRAWERTRP